VQFFGIPAFCFRKELATRRRLSRYQIVGFAPEHL
jgi:hypothetical protein